MRLTRSCHDQGCNKCAVGAAFSKNKLLKHATGHHAGDLAALHLVQDWAMDSYCDQIQHSAIEPKLVKIRKCNVQAYLDDTLGLCLWIID